MNRVRCFFFALMLGVLVLAPRDSFAERHQLFSSSVFGSDPVGDYDRIIGSLRPGDELVFSDGSVHRIGKRVGEGSTTVIFELSDDPGRVIRVPKASGQIPGTNWTYRNTMSSYQSGRFTLEKEGVPAVRFHVQLPGEFTIVDRVPRPILLREFLGGKLPVDRVPGGISGQNSRQAMEDALVEFARVTAGLREIGDFHSEQLAYCPDTKKWILLDWMDTHHELALVSEDSALKARSVFVGPPGNRGQLFFGYLRVSETEPGNILFRPIRPQHEWIASLANRLHDTIREERILRVRSARLAPQSAARCIYSGLRSF